MRILFRPAVLLGAALVTAGCGAQPGSAAAPSSTASGAVPELPDDGGLVLQVGYTGGYVTPQVDVTQLPLVSVYADGRVLTQGPVAAVYPGPALPNIQVTWIDPARVGELQQHALDAGVGSSPHVGMPSVADAPDTRFTVVTDDGTLTTDVPALTGGAAEGQRPPGTTDEQAAARADLQGLFDELTGLSAEGSEPYRPDAVAAVVSTNVLPEASPEDLATWPGPPLPGRELSTDLDLYCVVARGVDAEAVLRSAAGATVATVWQDPDGGRWSVALRPLLPHEDGCADLDRA